MSEENSEENKIEDSEQQEGVAAGAASAEQEQSEEEVPSELSDEDKELALEVEPSALIEALLFANGEPLGIARLSQVTGFDSKTVEDALESIKMKCELDESGIELVCVAGKYQFRTKVVFSGFIQQLKASRPRRLTPAALETLAIVAYRQPIVKADVEKIRGVDATPTIKTLLERSLIRIVGHKETPGQPALYGTTDEFLKIFGLRSLSELPTLRDLKELEEDPGETEEQQAQDAEEPVEQQEPVEHIVQ